MRLRERELPLDPEIERELEAIDRALAGQPVEADLADLAELTRELRSERAAPEPEFAGRLDEQATEGFRPVGGFAPVGRLSRLRTRLAATPPRRLLAPAGAAATLLVAVGVGIGVSDQIGGPGETPQPVSTQPAAEPSAPATGAAEQVAPNRGEAGGAARDAERRIQNLDNFSANRAHFSRALRSGGADAQPIPPGQRKVAQKADLVLSTEPEGVRDVADEVVQVVDRYRGFVVSSSVTSGEGGSPEPRPANGGVVPPAPGLPGATFHLKVPAPNLQAALGDLSGLAHVSSRTENVNDITKRFNAADERLNGLEAQRDRLLRQLGRAVTIEEQQSLKARLRIVEQQLVAARGALADVRQRIHLVPMDVQILAEEGVNAGGGGDWSLGDAVHDAGRVLAVSAGVLLVSAAVLGPLAILAALAWLVARTLSRWRRERALDQI